MASKKSSNNIKKSSNDGKLKSKRTVIVLVFIAIITAIFILVFVLASNMKNEEKNENMEYSKPINNNTHPGLVTLNVKDILLLKDFYTKTLLFDVIKEGKNLDGVSDGYDSVILGKEGKEIIELKSRPDLSASKNNDAGLYHVAIVYNTRGELARTVFNVLQNNPYYYSGSANHSVSEAFYFSDPEGNGIELYFDIDKKDWTWTNGKVQMDTTALDEENYLKKYLGTSDNSSKDKIAMVRHVHLKAGNIAAAKDFYVKKLGFTLTSEMPTAIFVSAGGYHHHIALNTWVSNGAGPRAETLGLDNFELIVPKDYLSVLESRLKHYEIVYKNNAGVLELSDPWNNNIRIIAE